jgi:5-methylthioadenosine/S-adenosylhomocysteine deaminase
MLDWSHIINSPAHADAAIRGLADSGIRGIFAHGVAQVGRSAGATGQPNSQKHSEDIRRVQEEYFKPDDQLLTLALASGGPEFSSVQIHLISGVLERFDRKCVDPVRQCALVGVSSDK